MTLTTIEPSYLPAAVEQSRTVNTLELVGPAAELANRIAKTNFVPTAYRGKPDELLACFLAGHELDVPPMTSMRLIHIVDGRPTFAAELMRAKVIAAGHELWIEESSNASATLCGRRREWPPDRVTRIVWTMDDAKRAGLERRNNWRAYPADMLVARATGRLVRSTFPDVMAGIAVREEVEDGYLDDELGDNTAGELAPPPDAPPAPAPRKRSTRKAAAKKPPTTPTPADARPALPGEAAPSSSASSSAPAMASAKPPLPADAPTPADVVEGLEAMAAQRPPTESAPEPTAEAANAPEEATGPEEQATNDLDEARRKRSTAVVLILKEVGVEAADDRHAFLEWATGGRTSSAKDVTGDEVDMVRSVCERIEAGELVLLRDATGALIVSDPVAIDDLEAEAEALPDEPEFDVDGDGQDDGIEEAEVIPDDDDDGPVDLTDAAELRGWLRGLNVRIPDAIREAQRIAGTIGRTKSPGSLEDLAADAELVNLVAAWVAERSSQ